ncbi:MAG: DUF1800 family protein [Blastocatellia bacterium]
MTRNSFRRVALRLVMPCLCAALLAPAMTRTPAHARSPHPAMPPAAAPPSEADTVRFLEQATFGPADALIAKVQAQGFDAWLTEQFSAPVSAYPDLPVFPASSATGCPQGTTIPNCFRDNYTMYPLQVRFFQNALNGEDQLRQRVSFALSQILVVSGVEIQQPSSMGLYLNLLTQGAFGNFRDLLYNVTLSPAMGDYLDMVNNTKPIPAKGIEPNENYAREVLQLFSIGTTRLNPDGTPQTDAAGNPREAYDQETIEGFAHVFTGWTYAPLPGQASRASNPRNYAQAMILYRDAKGVDVNHDKGAKTLLQYNAARYPVIAAGQDGEKEIGQAIDNIFYHPNVGPFIGKQLIQRLVTSNPSPGYVRRVTAAFNDNGGGIRGDLRAVVRAILLDAEARGDAPGDAQYGRLREPVQFIAGLLRAFGASSDGVLADYARNMGQNLFNSPSVFNYFPPDYVVPGTAVTGPEFAIQNSSAAISRLNFVNTIAFSRINISGSTGTQINLGSLQILAANPVNLVERLNRLLLHGTMPAQMKNEIVRTVTAIPAASAARRAQTALYLTATASPYQVER